MLVLSRREHERIKLGDAIVVTVVRVAGDRVRLGIDAPSDIPILRQELEQASGPSRCCSGQLTVSPPGLTEPAHPRIPPE